VALEFDLSLLSAERSVGQWLRGLRAVRGYSSNLVAERAGLAVERLEAIEAGTAERPELREMAAILRAIDGRLVERLVQFATTLGASAVSIDDASELSHLASRIVAAFGCVSSTATRGAVADLLEAVAGYGAAHRLNA